MTIASGLIPVVERTGFVGRNWPGGHFDSVRSVAVSATPQLLADGFVFLEGPRWRGDHLWFSDMHGEAVHTVDLSGKVETVVALPGREPSGLGFLPDGSLLIVSMLEPEILRWDGHEVRVHANLSGLVHDRCNDMVVDARGNAYAGTYPAPPDFDGVLVLVEPDGSARIAATDVKFPNGTVITDEGRTMILAESTGRRLTGFTIEPDGSLVDREELASCGADAPDGICLDVDGAIWAAFPLPHEFRRIAPGGEVLDRIPMGDRLAIACTLGGPEMRTLFLLTALQLPGESIRGTRDAAIHIVEVDAPGTGSP
jgi:sugar lactone lactonase YvrE